MNKENEDKKTETPLSQSAVEGFVSDVAAVKLLESIRQISLIEKKSNLQIVDLLIEHLWGDYEIDSIQSALLEVTIERLRH